MRTRCLRRFLDLCVGPQGILVSFFKIQEK